MGKGEQIRYDFVLLFEGDEAELLVPLQELPAELQEVLASGDHGEGGWIDCGLFEVAVVSHWVANIGL
jgi:hypothetical protein